MFMDTGLLGVLRVLLDGGISNFTTRIEQSEFALG